ncbi:hypothetical protein SNEBB_007998 [Seison nebaliae]|nr:hypothetical protein SNEBB_007998 [Seison nebaliae]
MVKSLSVVKKQNKLNQRKHKTIKKEKTEKLRERQKKKLEEFKRKVTKNQKKVENEKDNIYSSNDDDDDEDILDKRKRNFKKLLLPIIGKDGNVIHRTKLEEELEEYDNNSLNHINSITSQKKNKKKSINDILVKMEPMERLRYRRKLVEKAKEEISFLSKSIISNPEKNVERLTNLLSYGNDKNKDTMVIIRQYACISLVEIFKDILPSYRIRQYTEKELDQRMKKMTKEFREYEEHLLSSYQQYLEILEKNLSMKTSKKLQIMALKCYGEILLHLSHFNYINNVIIIFATKMGHSSTEIRTIVGNYLRSYLVDDETGELSLAIVNILVHLCKNRNYNVSKELIEIFSYCSVDACPTEEERLMKRERKTENVKLKDKEKSASRKNRREMKRLRKTQEELIEKNIETKQKKKIQNHTKILEKIFLVYFHILKNDNKSILLASILKGLRKFSHLINVEYYGDIVNILCLALHRQQMMVEKQTKEMWKVDGGKNVKDMIERKLNVYTNDIYRHNSSNMEEHVLSVTSCLHCIETIILLWQNQSSMTNMFRFDPQRIISHLYRFSSLCYVHHVPSNFVEEYALSACNHPFYNDLQQENQENLLVIIIRIIGQLFQYRNRTNNQSDRLMAFLHRLFDIALLQENPFSLLIILHQFYSISCKYGIDMESYLNLEEETSSRGIFNREIIDPDQSFATCSHFYQFPLINRHYGRNLFGLWLEDIPTISSTLIPHKMHLPSYLQRMTSNVLHDRIVEENKELDELLEIERFSENKIEEKPKDFNFNLEQIDISEEINSAIRSSFNSQFRIKCSI